jgi:hypothetical protein
MTHRRPATGGCADAFKAYYKGSSNPCMLAVTALRAMIEAGFERFTALTEARYKNLFQFSFVCLRHCH